LPRWPQLKKQESKDRFYSNMMQDEAILLSHKMSIFHSVKINSRIRINVDQTVIRERRSEPREVKRLWNLL
jgi:hypothetical protein